MVTKYHFFSFFQAFICFFKFTSHRYTLKMSNSDITSALDGVSWIFLSFFPLFFSQTRRGGLLWKSTQPLNTRALLIQLKRTGWLALQYTVFQWQDFAFHIKAAFLTSIIKCKSMIHYQGLRALKFYQSAGFCKIYYSHFIFEVIAFLSKIQNHYKKLSN